MIRLLNFLRGKALPKLLLLLLMINFIFVSTSCAQIKKSQLKGKTHSIRNVVKNDAQLKVIVDQIGSTLRFRVQFEKESTKPVRVLIQSDRGKIIFSQLFYSAKYIGRFDLSGVKEGIYHFVICTNTESYKQSFHIRTISMRMVTKSEDYPPLVQRAKYP